MNEPDTDVTEILLRWNSGNKEALDELIPQVTNELRRLARLHLAGEGKAHTLQPTALVNEAYLRLVDRRRVDWQSRSHFFGFAARVMRRVLVEHARARHSAKRGGGATRVTLGESVAVTASREVDLLALDSALERLAKRSSEQSRIVELRYFSGLSLEETAEVMSLSAATVSRKWAVARAWLYRALESK